MRPQKTSWVTAEWAELNLDNPSVVFVEVDEDTTAYHRGHIEGAVKLDWRTDLQDPVPAATFRPTKTNSSELLSERGISNDDTVILYGGNNNWFAAYAYWYLKLYGHEKRQAARWRAQEVGNSTARPADHRGRCP